MSQDRQLQNAVRAELDWEPSIDAARIGVAADAGVVTLSGHVANYAQKQAAETAARRVKGVKAVAEEIQVRLPFDVRRTDDEIAAAAVHRLAWDVLIPKDAIKVKVENGWMTLSGEVAWNYQKEAATQDMRSLYGVVGVSNDLNIKQKINISNISDDITHALHRSWYFDPSDITVHAKDGKVTLTGTVHSPHDRQLAAATAWSAPGVTDVENELRVV
jgi:osmotically-inducible protein OsmY